GADGCAAGKVATFDLRRLSAPVVLTGSPFLVPDPSATAHVGGEYEGTVSDSATYAGGAYGPYYYAPPSEAGRADNDAQLNASKALGGRPNSAIVDLEISVRTMDLYVIAGYVSAAEISARGTVIDVVAAGADADTGATRGERSQ